ncbi:Carbohydrate binding domain-containing protein [Mariniphaga anaerophila]|uniref:Carbohydrate binding domain-containing protein n=1 Tax=Mariniphaga anaerophila TaxID=1484053 RepID=A0A1M5DIV5_9BACT|nr:right-handed parallel beta-helix repeat-containing protein [Mariniphaga anaerophila]SHF66835.1 Carbohydrate binding domain-containing protein [Mariniphaga anaerophila]
MNRQTIIGKTGFFVAILLSALSFASAQNIIKNSGFESGDIVPYWSVWPENNGIYVSIDSEVSLSGSFSARLANNEVYLYQRVVLEPNTKYTLKASVKSELGDVIYLGVNNHGNEPSNIIFQHTEFKTDSLIFTTGENPDNDANIYVWKVDGTGKAWVDDVSLIADKTGQAPDEPGGLGTYYVSSSGNDNNAGTSPSDAWQTIEKVNRMIFQPGDQVLFEGGEAFYGCIRLNEFDSGVVPNYVSFGSYGAGRATINAGAGSGLVASDCQFLKISNLNFVGDGRKTGNSGNGINLNYCSNVLVDSVEVSGFQHAGVVVKNTGNNFRITNIYAHENGYAGIYFSGNYKNSLSDIYIGHCIADNNPGDPTVLDNHSGNGIFVYLASSILIEYCKASNNGWDMPRTGNGPGGIWVAEVDSAIIQHCISHSNKTSDGGQDGLGFDLDGGTTNSVIQYCLSYNNEGAGYGLFQYDGASQWKNNTVRYCISENDGNVSARGAAVFWNGAGDSDQFQGLHFYNNVIYNSAGPALAFLDHLNDNFRFYNNIFVSEQSSVYNGINNERFAGNCWYSFNNSFYLDSEVGFLEWAQSNNQEMVENEIVGMYENPEFINPGNSVLEDPAQLGKSEDYTLAPGSPVINAGLDLSAFGGVNPGKQDFSGYPLTQVTKFDMGAFEHQQKQKIVLTPGWNFISIRVLPANPDLMDIFQPLIKSGNLVKIMDENGYSVENYGFVGEWMNFIGDLDRMNGYRVNVVSADTLEVTGIAIDFPIEISLSPGWNIIPWPAEEEQNALAVLQPLIDEGCFVKVVDENGSTIEKAVLEPGWENSIGNFKPGKGYLVKVNSACRLILN